MKRVVPNKVLPDWAIEELGQVAEEYGLKITVKQTPIDWPSLEITVKCGQRDFHFIVPMRSDWEDLFILGEGDLWYIVEQRHLETFHA